MGGWITEFLQHHKGWFEGGFLVVCIVVSLHLIEERVSYRRLPNGDQGSWMTVAAELSRGEGFTTRWLEFHYLKPYCLPRPDDYRYPGLVLILASIYRVFGISYFNSLWTVGVIFILFSLAVYFAVRKYYGTLVAGAATMLTIVSLLQLHWNTRVYTEGLIGLVLGALIWWTGVKRPEKTGWWIGAGLWLGCLYLVRPTALLMTPGLLLAYLYYRRSRQVTVRHLCWALFTFILICSPWLIRTYVHFGSPLHSGGHELWKGELSEINNAGMIEYFYKYGFWFQLKRMFHGLLSFWHAMSFYEHGLHVMPVLFAAVGALRKRPFYNPLVAGAFLFTFLFAVFVAFLSGDAGLRYFTPFLPFIYAYGIYSALDLARLVPQLNSLPLKLVLSGILCGVLLLPVFYPHKYYERKFSTQPGLNQEQIEPYLQTLDSLTQGDGIPYLAGELCHLNFLLRSHCIGLQSRSDKRLLEHLPRAMDVFQPGYLAYRDNETNGVRGRAIMAKLNWMGWHLNPVFSNPVGTIYKLEKPESASGAD